MFKFYKKKNRKKEGFTLVETLIALFIFSLSVVVVMTVLSQGISSTNYARNKMIATYLAQEGIEYFRNMRDTSMLYTEVKHDGWINFITKLTNSGCNNGFGCYFNNNIVGGTPIMNIVITPCGGDCPNLWYDNGTYDYSNSGEKTSFIRKMSFEILDSSIEDQIKILSEVSWTQQSGNKTVLFSQNLSAWIE